MSKAVVDTNALVVANGDNPGAGAACQLAAVVELRAIKEGGELVLDACREILSEYRKHCSYAGQPGVGDEFFRWAVDNMALLEVAELTGHEDRRFEEFPDDAGLATFDWDDRVFVAVSRASASAPRIVNAVDSDYSHHAETLARHGVLVHELCPDVLKTS